MSLFPEYQVEANYYSPSDSNTTKKTTRDYTTPDFSFQLNNIHLGVVDRMVEGQTFGEYRCVVDSASGAQMTKGGMVRVGLTSELYEIVDNPEYVKLFDKYKLNLKKSDALT